MDRGAREWTQPAGARVGTRDPGTDDRRSGLATVRHGVERTGVLLVAHGSARSPDAALPVLELARGLRRRGFSEVRTGFWKEEPFLHQVLDTLLSSRIVVLPVFLAEGYFSRVVVPRELGLAYGRNRRNGRDVRLLPPLGASARMDDLVTDRALAALPRGASPAEAALVVLGHGTPVDPRSGDTVREACRRMDGESGFGRVVPAFIDQEPRMEEVVRAAPEPVVVLVPFLVAAGFHGGITVPRDLELSGATTSRGGRTLAYAEPVGTHPRVARTVETVILEALASMGPDGSGGTGGGEGGSADSAGGAPDLARALATAVRENGPSDFLQVRIAPRDDGSWELRHAGDVDASPSALRLAEDLAALEALARTGPREGAARPLRTTADLARGWRHRAADDPALLEALIALYGSAPAQWLDGRRGEVEAVPFRERARVQSGLYGRTLEATDAQVRAAVARCCDGLPCLRTRAWDEGRRGPAVGDFVVPCPTACPLLLSAVLAEMGERESPLR